MKKLTLGIALFMLGAVTTFAAAMTFPDVLNTDWFYDGVAYSSENGLMTGYADGTFGPNDALTRAQLATVLMRTDIARLETFETELNALRLNNMTQLQGATWQEYKDSLTRFPVEGLQGIDGMTAYQDVQDNLTLIARDDTEDPRISIYSANGMPNSPISFFIRVEGVNTKTYGPFYDNVNALATAPNTLGPLY